MADGGIEVVGLGRQLPVLVAGVQVIAGTLVMASSFAASTIACWAAVVSARERWERA